MRVEEGHRQLALTLKLRRSSTFAGFRVGANGPVVAAVRDLLAGTADAQLLLYGPSGSGKTHLLESACHDSAAQGRTSVYLPLQELEDDQADALSGLDGVDVVCLDRLESKLGQPDWEVALFDLLSRRRMARARLLLAAADHPQQLDVKLKDLRSRLLWGPALALKPLDDDEKLAALTGRARDLGLELLPETASYLLQVCPRDLASLMTTLERLDHASLQWQRKLTVPFVKSVLQTQAPITRS